MRQRIRRIEAGEVTDTKSMPDGHDDDGITVQGKNE